MGQKKISNLHIVTDIKVYFNRPMTKVNSVRGKPKSGRIWKSEGKKKSTLIKVKSLHKSWTVRMKERAEKLNVKKYQNELEQVAKEEKERKRLRTEENKKRKEENALKSEIVQTIKNTAKIKRMKKKHLRNLQKR